MVTPVLVVVAIVLLYLVNSVKILREYERGVIFRLGRALPVPKGPGIILVFRPFDQMVRISLRQDVLEVPAQSTISATRGSLKTDSMQYENAGLVFRCAMFSNAPVERSSRMATRHPSARQRSARCD